MSESPTVLIVDDEEQLLALISYALTSSGFNVCTARTGMQALDQVAAHTIDLIVLDVLLPDTNGLDLCQRLHRYTEAPVIFLPVRSDQADVIAGLAAGGDDYLAKPFSVEELLLRINAVLRRSAPQNEQLQLGELTLKLDSHEATVAGEPIDLTPLEFRFLRYLAINRTRIISTLELVDEVWGVADLGSHDPIVKTVVYRIRKKLDHSYPSTVEIRNVRGVGYQLRVCNSE